MINVIVTYQIKPDFVNENKLNIKKFLKEFETLDNSKFNYSVYLKNDGLTFVHISNYADEKIQNELLNVPSFLEFQKKRDESGLNDSHKVQLLEYIGSNSRVL
jgi:hypothetical protein